MTRRQYFGLVTATSMIALAAARPACAAIKASDKASNAAYAANPGNGAWQGLDAGESENPPGNDNGGFGFLPWDFGGGSYDPGGPYDVYDHFIDGVDFPASAFNNLGGPAWGLANSGYPSAYNTAIASRPFATPLVVGDIFSVEIDTPKFTDYNDYLGNPGYQYPFAIIAFDDANGMETLKVETGYSAFYGDFPWRYTDNNANNADFGNILPSATMDGSSVQLKVLTPTTAQVTIDGVQRTITFDNGIPASVAFVQFFNDAGSGTLDPDGNPLVATPTGEHEFFFDNLLIQDSAGPIVGDFDGNGHVEGADLTKWKGDVGVNGNSDADNDLDSDGNDIVLWQRHLSDPHAATATVGAVPEPASIALASCVACLFAFGRGRTDLKA